MLLVAQVRAEHLLAVGDEPASLAERAATARSTIPACTHIDGSARIQTVNSRTNPEFHRLLSAFHDLTSAPSC